MNKILEILDKKEKKIIRTGSLWDWNHGYPESQWELLCSLEGGQYFEDENKISFITTSNEEIGLPKYFLIEKSKSKAIYGSIGTIQIHKDLINKGIFELTDRVGHYIKIRVEPMFNEVESNESDFKSVVLNGYQLALLFSAFSDKLLERPQKGESFYESNDDDSLTLFFKRDYYSNLNQSILKAFIQGKLAQSNSESEWNKLKNIIAKAKISQRDDIENLERY